ncbi:MAG: DUF3014 domain-containing protein [Gammaproteobacteria bacterium]|nr:DUF3014 domain-containing protein [Gammaproteobacteria bacterium]
MNKSIIAVAAAAVLAGVGGWYYWARQQQRHAVAVPAPAASVAPVGAPPSAPPAIHYPVPSGNASGISASAALPALEDSDPSLREALGTVIGADAVKAMLSANDLVRRIVVTVDNLARAKLPVDRLPVPGPSGAFLVAGDAQHATIDPRNYARYAPYVDLLRRLDMHALAGVYFRFYPLFEQVYRGLGYPDGYFNDRLIAVIDLLLATPQPQGPIELIQPHVQYEFADPKLEALSSGQKVLLRIGPDNASLVKAKLAELRAALTASPPPR